MDTPIEILADPSERGSDVVDCLAAIEGVTVRFTQLAVGDYQANGFVFKRKTLTDFQASITDGSYANQMSGLARSARRGVLIIEGSSDEVAAIRENQGAIQGALVTAGLILGIPILRAKDGMETARVMVYTARHQHLWNGHFYSRPDDRSSTGRQHLT